MKLILITLSGLLFLTLWLIIGYPIEISNLNIHRFVAIFFSFCIAGVFIFLFKLSRKLKGIILRFVFFTLLTLLLTNYLGIGLYNCLISSGSGPVWEDTQVYTNANGQKVIFQFRRTSGSIFDYRKRLILIEFANKNRISIDWKDKWMHGIWKVKDLKEDKFYRKDFNKTGDILR